MKHYRRTPKHYRGTKQPEHQLGELLPHVLKHVSRAYKERPDLVLGAWESVIGEQLKGQTIAESFSDGILYVKVKQSSLYTLLRQYERPRLLARLRERFPDVMIKNIAFRVG